MTGQPTLFDPGPATAVPAVREQFARHDDPSSSHDGAAGQEPLGESALQVLEVLAEIGDGTAADIHQHLPGIDRNCISRRLTSLARHELARVLPDKRPGGKGVDVLAFEITPLGRRLAGGEVAA